MRYALALLAVMILAGCAAEPDAAAGRVVIDLEDGSQVTGRLLARDARTVHVAVGEDVLSIPRGNIRSLTEPDGEGQADAAEVKRHSLYATGTGTVKSVSAFSDELGPAIVTVKTPAGLGTGWFCHPDGYVITNNHVVAGERTISVTAFHTDGDRTEKIVYKKVKLVALDDNLDLALLHIEEDLGLDVPQLLIGDSTALQVGDPVFTIGNPLGLERTTSDGAISKVNRKMDGRLYLQMTTPIAPGNSGGPLFNERGEVVGVTNMGYIFMDGLAFAIPSKYVKEFLDNVEAFAYDPDNPNSGVKYLEAPVVTTDGKIRFTESSFVKVGAGASCITVADVDGDGVQDIVYANNNRAHIGVVTRREGGAREPAGTDFEDINRLPEDENFEVRTHAVRSLVSALAVGDLTGDGRADILLAGDIDGVAVMDQREDGTFAPARRLAGVEAGPRRDALALRDFDGDGRADIFALAPMHFTVLREGAEPRRFELGAQWRDALRNYELADVNGDGRLDVVFFVGNADYAAHVFCQDDAGRFTEDQYVAGNLVGDALHLRNGGGPLQFVTVDPGVNRVRLLELGTERRPARADTIDTSVSAVTFGSEGTTPPDYALADVNGDGRTDLLTVNRAGSEFVLLLGGEDGWTTVRSPAPRNVGALAVHRFDDGRTMAVCFSPDDRIFGLSRVDASGVSFPRPLNVAGEVQSLQVEDLDGATRLVWIAKDGNNYNMQSLAVADLRDAAFADAQGSVDVAPAPLAFAAEGQEPGAALPRKPDRVAFADFNGDNLRDAVVYWSYSGKQGLYLGAGDGRFNAVIEDSKFLDEAQGATILVADFDRNGRRDVLLPQGDFVRVLRVDDKGKLYVERQFNWRLETVERLLPFGQDADARFLALSGPRAAVVRFDAEAGAFVREAVVDLAGIETGRIEARDMDGDGRPDIVAVGVNSVQFVHQADERRVLDGRIVFDAPSDNFTYWRAWPADLDADGADEVLLFDSRKAMFEIHTTGEDGRLRPLARHRLFEKTIFQSAETDSLELPSELAATDLDGNGAVDLVFLLQDRLAVYLQDAD